MAGFGVNDIPENPNAGGTPSAGRPPTLPSGTAEGIAGISGTIKDVFDTYDTVTKTKIEMEAFKGVDDILQGKTFETGDDTEKLPQALIDGQKSIDSLRGAAEQGVLSPLELATQMSMLSKRLRNAVPQGYGSYVNRMIGQALGSNPADDERRALLQEMEDAKSSRDSTYKSDMSFIHSNIEVMGDDVASGAYKQATGRDFGSDLAAGNVQTGAAKEAILAVKGRDYRESRVATILKQESSKRDLAYNELAGDWMKDTLVATGTPFAVLQKTFDDFLSNDNTIDYEESLKLNQLMSTAKAYMTSRKMAFIAENNLPKDQAERLDNVVDNMFSGFSDAINNKDTGYIGAAMRDAKYRQESYVLAVQGQPLSQLSNAMQLMGYPDEARMLVLDEAARTSMGYKDLSEGVQYEIAQARAQVATGFTSMATAVDNIQANNPTDKKRLGALVIEDMVGMINNPSMPDEGRIALAKQIFGSKNLDFIESKIAPAQRADFFKRIMSPKVIEAMKSDPTAKAQMERYAVNAFSAITKPFADQIIDGKQNAYLSDVTFDGKHFVYSGREATWGEALTTLDMDMKGTSVNLFKAVNDMNTYIDVMSNVMGEDSGKWLSNFMPVDSINEMEKNPTFIQGLAYKVHEWVTGAEHGENPKNQGKSYSQTTAAVPPDAGQVLDFISKAEGADYSTLYGGTKKDMSGMTVREVMVNSKAHGKRKGSSATGRYQFMYKTLGDLVDREIIGLDDKFTPETQDKLGYALLRDAGWERWKAGRISDEKFLHNISGIWAGIATPFSKTGGGRYDGTGKRGAINKATVSVDDGLEVLRGIKSLA